MTTTLSTPPPSPPPGPAMPSSSPPPPSPGPPARRGGAGRVVLIVVGAVLTVISIGWTSMSLVSLLAHAEHTTSISFPAGVRHLVIHSDSGSITLHGSSSDQITGERRVSRGLTDPSFTEQIIGDTLTIRSTCHGPMAQWCSVGYDLTVPRSLTVNASSGGGSVEASDLSGDLDLRSDAGGVDVARASGNLTLRSSAGGVEADGISGASVTAASSAGEVNLIFVGAPDHVVARSSAGSVTIELPADAPPYRVQARSDSDTPTIAVATDPNATRTIDATSTAGEVTVQRVGG